MLPVAKCVANAEAVFVYGEGNLILSRGRGVPGGGGSTELPLFRGLMMRGAGGGGGGGWDGGSVEGTAAANLKQNKGHSTELVTYYTDRNDRP
uniref:Uncharacterized protein n=1 Tax=Magallana gigas TaxID=29159 RepID=K1QEM0_MAGGI